MIIDAHTIPDGTTLEADICVIGGGPAGITLAREFVGCAARIIVLESGGRRSEARAQTLNVGDFVGAPYAGLDVTRHRQLGGTASIWNTPLNGVAGAKYVPLDACDFDSVPGTDIPGWPFGLDVLETYYEQAQSVCGLGPFEYSGEFWCRNGRPFPMADSAAELSVYQFGPARLFTDTYVRELEASETVEVMFHATALALGLHRNGRAASRVDVGTLDKRRFQIRPRHVVLAAGAVENARLLLVSKEPGQDTPGDKHGWVGRCFMEHPRDYSLSLLPDEKAFFTQAAFFDRHEAADGTIIGGRIALDTDAVTRQGLLNASMTMLPLIRDRSRSWRHRIAAWARDAFGRERNDGYGWSTYAEPEKLFSGFRFILNSEQRPRRKNRILLSTAKDALGVPQVEVHWNWNSEDEYQLDRLRKTFASALNSANVGSVRVDSGQRIDPNAHHHSGTTRMSSDPAGGVVDIDGCVHGMENLHATGASVFPTSGFANPTLTVIALSIRLAERLQERL